MILYESLLQVNHAYALWCEAWMIIFKSQRYKGPFLLCVEEWNLMATIQKLSGPITKGSHQKRNSASESF